MTGAERSGEPMETPASAATTEDEVATENPDLHGTAREVAESGDEGAAETPGGG
ncbi:MAG TPA: hypothetical protein VD813_07205 [Pseudonocardia sp.]|nr:hypothetical protein [Pseudonocardia sp.]